MSDITLYILYHTHRPVSIALDTSVGVRYLKNKHVKTLAVEINVFKFKIVKSAISRDIEIKTRDF